MNDEEPIDVPFDVTGENVPGYVPQPPAEAEITFNREKLEKFKHCVTCGQDKPLRQFRASHGRPYASTRCKNCSEKLRLRKQKLLADKNARELMQMFSRQVRTAKAKSVPHTADIASGMLDLFGGVREFNIKMKEAIDRAIADEKHKVVQDYYLAITRWCGESHEHENEDFSKLSTEELESIANEMALQAMKNELGFKADAIPMLAELSAKTHKPPANEDADDGIDDADIDDMNDLGEWIDPALQ